MKMIIKETIKFVFFVGVSICGLITSLYYNQQENMGMVLVGVLLIVSSMIMSRINAIWFNKRYEYSQTTSKHD